MDSSSTASSAGDYEVFLSFRGVDTRQGFTDILYQYLTMAEIRVFRDDDELAIGDKIDSILAGLASSKICIPIFSPKFAESKWCLREVAEMVALKKTIVPVFYKVSPDDVKLKQGSVYWDDIRKLEGGNHEEEIDKWKNALKEAGSIKGRELGDTSYSKFCMEFVDKVLSKLGPRKKLEEIDHFTGKANKARTMKLLDMRSSEKVVYVGIHGMGGIGKTTITKLIYNQFLSSFDYCGFVPDIREFSASNGIKSLPKYLYDNLQPKSVTPFSKSQIADWFKNKKVLLILDDVDSYEQIREIAGESSWFGLGSRIVLTTRDKKVLEDYAEESGTEVRYLEMKELDRVWALELFSKCAFRKDSPPSPFQNLSERAVASVGGLPLAITVIAKYLRNKKEAIWEEIIEKLKKAPPKEVKEKLMISYNALEEEQKSIFLDIACFFIYNEYTETSSIFYMWVACGLCPRWSLEVLQSMSLVKVDKYKRLMMHDQLRDLGRDIVRTQSGGDLMKQSRLWEHDEIMEVLKCKKKHKNNIEAIQLGWIWARYGDFIDEDSTSFANLRYLHWQPMLDWRVWGKEEPRESCRSIIVKFSGLPQLKWFRGGSVIQIRNLALSNLVILDLSYSDVNENWDGWSQIQAFKKLKVLNLSDTQVTSTPVFSENMALERLDMGACYSLRYIHPSISKLHHLNYLSFRGCSSLENLPECLGELHALQELNLEGTKISSLPDSIGRLEKLKHLHLSSYLVDLPESFGNLRSLVRLDIRNTNITRLPCSIGGLEKLEYLNLRHSKKTVLPESFGDLKSLVYLDISDSEIAALPSSINRLSLLQTFKLDRCPQLHELPQLPSSLTELKINSEFLKKVSDLSNLQDVTSLELIGGSNILEWNGSFPSKLQSLTIQLFCISRLPDFSSCSQLSYLRLSCDRSLKVLPNMSGFRKLLTLEIESCKELVQIPGIGKLHCLTSLLIKNCPALEWLENLRELKELKRFDLISCPNLTEVRGLSELQAITKVRVQDYDDLTALKERKELTLVGCHHELPELPSSLTELKIDSKYLKKVSDLSNLQDATSLELIGHSSILEWDGSFPSKLQSLTIDIFRISRLPDLSSCSQLSYLILTCIYSLKVLPNMSGLRKLLTLEIAYCEELVRIPGIGKLHSLTSLLIKNCPTLECLENLRELKELKELNLAGCQKLREISGLGELQALTEVRVKHCESLEKFDDLTASKELKKVTLVGCRKLADSPGGEVPGHGELQLLDLLPNEMPHSLNQLENVSAEAEVDRHCQLMGSDLSLYCLPAEQSEAEDYPNKKRRRDQFISTDEGRLNMRPSSGDMGDDLSLRL